MNTSSPPLPSLVVASHNIGKIREISLLLAPYCQNIIPVASFSSVVPEENGHSFEENALIKARHALRVSSLWALADDSGLEIDALNQEPGIHSARLADQKGGFHKAMQYLLKTLEKFPEKQDRKARFVCALALVAPPDASPSSHPSSHSSSHSSSPPEKPKEWVFTGTIEGFIAHEISSEKHGFGYDPIFIPQNYSQTFASLGEDTKNAISHRKHAFDKLAQKLKSLSTPPSS